MNANPQTVTIAVLNHQCGRFALARFGSERLTEGSGVLDVAGGKAELAFEFLNLNNIHSTVIDPRPTALEKFVTKFEYGIYSRNPALAKWNPEAAKHNKAWLPQHLRLFFNDTLFERVGTDSDLEFGSFLDKAYHLAETTCWTNKGLVHEDSVVNTEEDIGIVCV